MNDRRTFIYASFKNFREIKIVNKKAPKRIPTPFQPPFH